MFSTRDETHTLGKYTQHTIKQSPKKEQQQGCWANNVYNQVHTQS